jgi:hypothetical protein
MRSRGRRSWQWLIGLSIGWTVVAVFGLAQIWSHVGSWREAALFFAFFPPFYVAAEAANSWLLSPAHGQAISPRQFSWLRILVALPIAAAWLGLSWFFAVGMLR